MKRRMSVEDEWRARLAARNERQQASRAKGSAGLAPAAHGKMRTGSIATPARRTTSGKHHSH